MAYFSIRKPSGVESPCQCLRGEPRGWLISASRGLLARAPGLKLQVCAAPRARLVRPCASCQSCRRWNCDVGMPFGAIRGICRIYAYMGA
eukprot:7784745-Pyramimonas_sp.AAC.1